MIEYIENTWDEFGVEHRWKHATRLDACTTERGTFVEMIHRPNWGIACYMDNAIQSCEVDEAIYHESLVHPVMASMPSSIVNNVAQRVMIIGGGEGATAREVLKWPVHTVDMFEWDKGVVDLFKAKYPQWAKGAWNDNRLTVHYDDIFRTIHTPPVLPYDVIIIDLFDPDESTIVQWSILLTNLRNWLTPSGSIAIYSGIRNILVKKQGYELLLDMIMQSFPEHHCTPYKVYIPSFSGESTFLLITPSLVQWEYPHSSHLTKEIWDSYKVFNY